MRSACETYTDFILPPLQDTDMQWAYLSGVRDYVLNKKDYLMTQVGNPEGPGKPNKKVRSLYALHVRQTLTSWDSSTTQGCGEF